MFLFESILGYMVYIFIDILLFMYELCVFIVWILTICFVLIVIL